jgi:putative PEP-CTERM system TPR-repeat lipoprotein
LPVASQPAPAADAAQFYEQAVGSFNTGAYRESVVHLKNALKAMPEHLPSRVLLGRSFLALNEPSLAEVELGRALASGADEGVVLGPLADAFLAQQKFQELLDRFPEGGRPATTEAALRVARGNAFLGQNRGDDAELAFGAAARLDPTSPAPLLGRARVSLLRGRPELAEDFADAATAVGPEEPMAWYLKGELRRLKGDVPGALRAYGTAIEANPAHLESRISRAALLIDAGQGEAARQDLDRVLERNPEHPQAVYLTALLLTQGGDVETARDLLARAATRLQSMPAEVIARHPPSLLLLGVVSFSQRNFELSRSNLAEYLKHDPAHLAARKMLGGILVDQRDSRQAVVILEPALKLAPNDPQVLALLGQAYMNERMYSAAAPLLEKAARALPDASQIRTELALARLALGRGEEAVKELAAVLTRDPKATRARVSMAMVLLNQGKADEALAVASELATLEPENPVAHNLVGLAHLARKDLPAARGSFERALAVSPEFLSAHHNLAAVELAAGDPAAAEQRYHLVLQEHRDDLPSLVGIARIAESQGRLEDAVRWLDRARRAHPEALGEHLRLAEVYLRLRKADAALEVAQEVDRRQPVNYEVLELIGRAQLAMEKPADATRTFRTAFGAPVPSASVLVRLAQLQLRAGDEEGARWTLEKAVGMEPQLVPAQSLLVTLDAQAGRVSEALARAEWLRQRQPGSPAGELLRGDVLLRAGRSADAITAYEAAQRIEAGSAGAVGLFKARRAGGQGEAAFKGLRAWLDQHPDDYAARGALAAALLETRQLPQAIAQHERLLQAQPDDASVLNNLAWLYHRTGDERSLETAERAYRLTPTDPGVLDTLGWILLWRGQPGRGIGYLREAQSRAAQQPDVRYHLGVALAQLGRTQEAAAELRAALAMGLSAESRPHAERLLRDMQAPARP